MKKIITKEPQYQCCLEFKEKHGLENLGLMSSHTWITDPKRLIFVLSRYKFVAKMFVGMDRVLEIGCADAFGSRIVSQEVNSLTAIDFDPVFIDDSNSRMREDDNMSCILHNILDDAVPGSFDGAYSLDVIEHIPKEKEDRFVFNIVQSLKPNGTVIIGTPSIESQIHASPASNAGHVNCKNQEELKLLLLKSFHNVFIFSMNDEVVHTGFYPMANYLLALCCNPKNSTDL